MLLGDDDYVHRGLGLDVAEREDLIILVDLVAGDLACSDLAENAVIHG